MSYVVTVNAYASVGSGVDLSLASNIQALGSVGSGIDLALTLVVTALSLLGYGVDLTLSLLVTALASISSGLDLTLSLVIDAFGVLESAVDLALSLVIPALGSIASGVDLALSLVIPGFSTLDLAEGLALKVTLLAQSLYVITSSVIASFNVKFILGVIIWAYPALTLARLIDSLIDAYYTDVRLFTYMLITNLLRVALIPLVLTLLLMYYETLPDITINITDRGIEIEGW